MGKIEMRYRFKPSKNELFYKNSSLAIEIHKDTEHEASLYIFNRRTSSIIAKYEVPLMQHCRNSMQNVEPIRKPKKKRKYIPVGRKQID